MRDTRIRDTVYGIRRQVTFLSLATGEHAREKRNNRIRRLRDVFTSSIEHDESKEDKERGGSNNFFCFYITTYAKGDRIVPKVICFIL